MSSDLRRTEDLLRLKTRNFIYQNPNGTFPRLNTVPRMSDNYGKFDWSNVRIDAFDNMSVPGNVDVSGSINVQGGISVASFNVAGDANIGGNLDVSGTSTFYDLVSFIHNADTVNGGVLKFTGWDSNGTPSVGGYLRNYSNGMVLGALDHNLGSMMNLQLTGSEIDIGTGGMFLSSEPASTINIGGDNANPATITNIYGSQNNYGDVTFAYNQNASGATSGGILTFTGWDSNGIPGGNIGGNLGNYSGGLILTARDTVSLDLKTLQLVGADIEIGTFFNGATNVRIGRDTTTTDVRGLSNVYGNVNLIYNSYVGGTGSLINTGGLLTFTGWDSNGIPGGNIGGNLGNYSGGLILTARDTVSLDLKTLQLVGADIEIGTFFNGATNVRIGRDTTTTDVRGLSNVYGNVNLIYNSYVGGTGSLINTGGLLTFTGWDSNGIPGGNIGGNLGNYSGGLILTARDTVSLDLKTLQLVGADIEIGTFFNGATNVRIGRDTTATYIGGSLDVSGTLTLHGSLDICGNLTVDGTTTLRKTLGVDGPITTTYKDNGLYGGRVIVTGYDDAGGPGGTNGLVLLGNSDTMIVWSVNHSNNAMKKLLLAGSEINIGVGGYGAVLPTNSISVGVTTTSVAFNGYISDKIAFGDVSGGYVQKRAGGLGVRAQNNSTNALQQLDLEGSSINLGSVSSSSATSISVGVATTSVDFNGYISDKIQFGSASSFGGYVQKRVTGLGICAQNSFNGYSLFAQLDLEGATINMGSTATIINIGDSSASKTITLGSDSATTIYLKGSYTYLSGAMQASIQAPDILIGTTNANTMTFGRTSTNVAFNGYISDKIQYGSATSYGGYVQKKTTGLGVRAQNNVNSFLATLDLEGSSINIGTTSIGASTINIGTDSTTTNFRGNITGITFPAAPVSSVTAVLGSGISVSPTTGDVVISNTGVTSLTTVTNSGLTLNGVISAINVTGNIQIGLNTRYRPVGAWAPITKRIFQNGEPISLSIFNPTNEVSAYLPSITIPSQTFYYLIEVFGTYDPVNQYYECGDCIVGVTNGYTGYGSTWLCYVMNRRGKEFYGSDWPIPPGYTPVMPTMDVRMFVDSQSIKTCIFNTRITRMG